MTPRLGHHIIQAAIELLSTEPRPPAATQLVGGGGAWRVRTGDHRILYEIRDGELLVLVLAVGYTYRRLCAAGFDARPLPG